MPSAPIPDVERKKLDALIRRGRAALGAVDEPHAIATAVNRWITDTRHAAEAVTQHDRAAIAAAFGDAISRAIGWSWAYLVLNDQRYLALVSPDEAHAHLPFDFLARQMVRGAEATALLLFNMLAAANLPPSHAGALSRVG
jgi:hypothetical protein